jgi:hypothetical protein
MMSYVLVTMTLAVGQVQAGAPTAPPAQYYAQGGTALSPNGSPSPTTQPAAPDSANGKDASATEKNGGTEAKDDPSSEAAKEEAGRTFLRRFIKANCDAWKDKDWPPQDEPEKPRRHPPEPWSSPPFPTHEYQGYPLIGVPPESHDYPLMKALEGTRTGDWLKDHKIEIYGWVTASGNWSTAQASNSPASYWLVPNRYELDQAIIRVERQLDSVQQDHIDWGFRSSYLYGIDYRYMTAGGWFSDQLLLNNRLYGFDPTEQYVDVYFPGITQGMILRVGRWIACPDIETQFAPDNYLASHSTLFTFDTYTQTGFMLTFKMSDQWILQAGLNSGNDMAFWYKGAVPCGYFGARWVSKDNNDSIYTVLNQINGAKFRHFTERDQPSGHDNFNYLVSTWEHKFTKDGSIHTATEAYFMWQRDAELGGTPSLGPVQSFGGGGGDGALIPGTSLAYGVLNYTEFAISKKDYICVRNEWWKDEKGMRSGFPGVYTSHTIGLSHNFNSLFQIRPEIGYYRNWTNGAFDLGAKKGITIYGFDMTYRF